MQADPCLSLVSDTDCWAGGIDLESGERQGFLQLLEISFRSSEIFVQPVTGAGTSCEFGNPDGKGFKKSLEARTV